MRKILLVLSFLFVVVLTACDPGYVIIEFDTFGADGMDSYKYYYEEEFELPEAPEYEGYDFVGWYTDLYLTEEFDGNPPTKNTALYAKWVKRVVTISINKNNGEPLHLMLVDEGVLIDPPVAPLKEGYEFSGWYTSIDGTELYDFDELILENVEIYAQWIKNDHFVDGYTVTAFGSDISFRRFTQSGDLSYIGIDFNNTLKMFDNFGETLWTYEYDEHNMVSYIHTNRLNQVFVVGTYYDFESSSYMFLDIHSPDGLDYERITVNTGTSGIIHSIEEISDGYLLSVQNGLNVEAIFKLNYDLEVVWGYDLGEYVASVFDVTEDNEGNLKIFLEGSSLKYRDYGNKQFYRELNLNASGELLEDKENIFDDYVKMIDQMWDFAYYNGSDKNNSNGSMLGYLEVEGKELVISSMLRLSDGTYNLFAVDYDDLNRKSVLYHLDIHGNVIDNEDVNPNSALIAYSYIDSNNDFVYIVYTNEYTGIFSDYSNDSYIAFMITKDDNTFDFNE